MTIFEIAAMTEICTPYDNIICKETAISNIDETQCLWYCLGPNGYDNQSPGPRVVDRGHTEHCPNKSANNLQARVTMGVTLMYGLSWLDHCDTPCMVYICMSSQVFHSWTSIFQIFRTRSSIQIFNFRPNQDDVSQDIACLAILPVMRNCRGYEKLAPKED